MVDWAKVGTRIGIIDLGIMENDIGYETNQT
jgi:hypothetical protein